MSEIIFVIGAGASVHCGTPIMKDFLDVARDLVRGGEVKEAESAYSNVLDAVGKLNAVHSKAILELDNVEAVYTAFEMGMLLGKLPGIEDEERIASLTPALRKVIGYTLEKTTKIPADSRLQGYYDFTNVMKKLIKQGRKFTVITFNYDLGLDYSLYSNGLLPDYCLEDIELRGEKVLYLKLHGSLNFGKCSNNSCGKIIPYRKFQYTEHIAGRSYSTLPIITKLGKQKCPTCGESLSEDPVIIPPTWNKTAYHNQINEVWRRAAYEMGDAEQVFVIGYSLPTTDWFFNYLYALGVDMIAPLQGFYVLNPDNAVRERFEKLLGPGVIQRFQYSSAVFDSAMPEVSKHLGI